MVFSFNLVGSVTDYDPNTGIGDESFTSYVGGSCAGALFLPAGSVVSATGTLHFIASTSRSVESVLTLLQDPENNIGDFSGTFADSKR